ncbi:thiamine biosynthesis lipoprotein ApbE [Sulfurifustis variabilis]|uniref:FAD:protein FMN transferase n=1 Tax=Sulfurifustis variabilis TaxID=1675686 RepID=A0A1B4V6Z9_9GAMM|nr:thiamine biosynthesis lipoprotein ApbE [Sulfurifustis variabilis]
MIRPRVASSFALAVALVLPAARPALAEWLSGHEAIMGTEVRVELWHEDPDAGRAGIAAVMEEMRRIDRLMSTYKPESELSRLNREAARGPVRVSRELFDLITRALEFSRLTGGAFDVTYSSVGYLYDYPRGVAPSEEEIARRLDAIDYRHVVLDAATTTVRYARAGVRIDLGGIAKGHAVDRSIALLAGRGVAAAIVTAGGDSRVLGDHRGRPWMIGIRDPRRREDVVAVLPLVNAAISTSGDYERYFERDGVRYHHILDPKTGKSARGLRSVSILGPDSTTTDALSTSVFVLGAERGMRLVERMPGVDALLIDDSGRLRFTEGLRKAIEGRDR